MQYRTANKKITDCEHGSNEKGSLMKHDTDTAIARILQGCENCSDCCAYRLLKASSVQGYTGLVDTEKTEAVYRRLSAGADYPEKDESGNPKYYWDCSPLSTSQSQTSWSDYMNRVRSLTNMGQQLLQRMAARAENQRRNPQDHATQTPLGLAGPMSMNDTLRRPHFSVDQPTGQEPQASNVPVVPLSSVPRRLQMNPPQRANFAAPPQSSRMNCPQPVSVPCDQGPSAPQSRIPTTRIPQRGTCNQQATNAAAPPRGSRHRSAQDNATRSRAIPTSQTQRYRTNREQRGNVAAPAQRTRAPQQPIPASQIQRYRTYREQRGNVAAPTRRTRTNCPRPVSVPRVQQGTSAPQCSIPTSRIPRPGTCNQRQANVAAPAQRSRMNRPQPVPGNQRTRAPQQANPTSQIQRYRTYREQRGNAAAPPRGTRMNRPPPVSVPCEQQGTSAPQCPPPTSRIPRPGTCNQRQAPPQGSRMNCPQPVSVPCEPQCPIPTSEDPQCNASTSRHNDICQEDDNAIDPCEMDDPRNAEPRCPNPRCSIPMSKDVPWCYDPNSPSQYERRRLSMERFLDECESSYMRPLGSPEQCPPSTSTSQYQTCIDHEPATTVGQEQNNTIQISGTITVQSSPESPRTMEAQPCPEAAPQPSAPQCPPPRPRCPNCPYSPDSLYRWLDRTVGNDVPPSPPRRLTRCSAHRQPVHQNPPANDFNSLVRFIDSVHGNDADPTAQQEQQTRSIRISGSFNARISAEPSGLQDVTPPSDYFDVDFSDETDDELNGC